MDRPRRSPKPSTPLASTALQVNITDLVAEYLVRHTFQNDGEKAIEAVFSFPIPLDAAFLGAQATLGGETVVAEIQPERQATRTYDDAISEGNSAVLLRSPEPGLLCMSLGNLMPGETGEIQLRFVTSLGVADGTARFSLPLVHRPRYGTWNLEALEAPTHDFAVEHPMSATIRVEGLLASAPVSCATHAARFARDGDSMELSITHAMLDRDLVLTFELSKELPATARCIEDGETSLGLVSFVLPMREGETRPLNLCLVLDCSGSMDGAAIAQSRDAMTAIIGALDDQDRIQILRFGSTVQPLLRRPLRATPLVRSALHELVQVINADLGGTEMGHALEQALEQLGPADAASSRAVILVTDGAVQPRDIAGAQAAASAAGIRIFVVAVGGSAGAEVLGPMAEGTGAVMERAVPAEPIDAGVMRQFRRAREAGAVDLQVTWPGAGSSSIPMGVAYPGDAVNLAASLPSAVPGTVLVQAPSLDFSLRVELANRSSASALRALLGQQRYRLAGQRERENIALQYGLLTVETSAVLVKIRADGSRSDELPVIVQVPEMAILECLSSSVKLNRVVARPAARRGVSAASAGYADTPMFLRQSASAQEPVEDKPRQSVELEMTVVTISVQRAAEILEELHRLLASAWIGNATAISMFAVIERLPRDIQVEAHCLIMNCGIPGNSKPGGLQMLLALQAALNTWKLSDEQEAGLAVAAAHAGAGKAWVRHDEASRLVHVLSGYLRQGLTLEVQNSQLQRWS